METVTLSRIEILRVLGANPLRLRSRAVSMPSSIRSMTQTGTSHAAGVAFDKRVAVLRTQQEIEQPALAMLYTKITEAISSLGLQCVRAADAENDPRVRVLAFGDAPLPPSIAAVRVKRVDALAVLQSDRERKRALWDGLREWARESG